MPTPLADEPALISAVGDRNGAAGEDLEQALAALPDAHARGGEGVVDRDVKLSAALDDDGAIAADRVANTRALAGGRGGAVGDDRTGAGQHVHRAVVDDQGAAAGVADVQEPAGPAARPGGANVPGATRGDRRAAGAVRRTADQRVGRLVQRRAVLDQKLRGARRRRGRLIGRLVVVSDQHIAPGAERVGRVARVVPGGAGPGERQRAERRGVGGQERVGVDDGAAVLHRHDGRRAAAVLADADQAARRDHAGAVQHRPGVDQAAIHRRGAEDEQRERVAIVESRAVDDGGLGQRAVVGEAEIAVPNEIEHRTGINLEIGAGRELLQERRGQCVAAGDLDLAGDLIDAVAVGAEADRGVAGDLQRRVAVGLDQRADNDRGAARGQGERADRPGRAARRVDPDDRRVARPGHDAGRPVRRLLPVSRRRDVPDRVHHIGGQQRVAVASCGQGEAAGHQRARGDRRDGITVGSVAAGRQHQRVEDAALVVFQQHDPVGGDGNRADRKPATEVDRVTLLEAQDAAAELADLIELQRSPLASS